MFASAVALAAALLAPLAGAQSYQEGNLTPDGYWHNRYHMLLSMAAYGNYNDTCPLTFTEAGLLNNFPNSTRPPWTVISTFGPTASGCAGYTAIVPEMNKALIIFQGNYSLEMSLPTEVVGWDDVGLAAETGGCGSCTVNRFAVQGYLECKEETNNFQAIREAYYGQSLVFSITGHGLGGMHSQIAAVDLYSEDIDYYNHAYGNPRVFNQDGAYYYNIRFNGEAGERGVYNDDQMQEMIPEGKNYAHAGTPFYYYGWNETTSQPNWVVCWLTNWTAVTNTTACDPQVWPTTSTTTWIEDHYFYMGSVGTCNQNQTANTTLIDAFVSAQGAGQAALTNLSALESAGQSMATAIVSSISASSVARTASTTASSSSASPTAATAPAETGSTEGSGASPALLGASPMLHLAAALLAGAAGVFVL